MSLAQQLQRQHLSSLVPYASARRNANSDTPALWLNANESPYSMDYTLDCSDLNRYPAFQSAALNQAYAAYAKVAEQQVLSCRGSDEAIDLLVRAFCEPNRDAVMITTPTYGMYAISAATQGAAVIDVPLLLNASQNNAAGQLDVDAICQRLQDVNAELAVKLVFLCSPSNPLANDLQPESLKRVLNAASEQALVVVDEAYIEFSQQPSVSSWLNDYPNLVVLRTLSKAFGLAGARCGFALANSDVIQVLQKVLAPYPLPELTLQVAQQALEASAIAHMQASVQRTAVERMRWQQALAQLAGVGHVYPSVTNFILLAVDDANALVNHCRADGILIRDQSAQPGLNNCVRISIGSADQNQRCLTSLQRYFADRQAAMEK